MNLRRPPRPLRYALQVLVVAVFTLWVWQGPVRVNLYDDRRPPAWGWHLFRSQGGDACDVRFYEHVDEGDRYIPRWRVLGYDAPREMPRQLRVIGPKQLGAHVRRFCGALRRERGEPVDVRAILRCPTKTDWRVLEDRDEDVCDPNFALPGERRARARSRERAEQRTARALARRRARALERERQLEPRSEPRSEPRGERSSAASSSSQRARGFRSVADAPVIRRAATPPDPRRDAPQETSP